LVEVDEYFAFCDLCDVVHALAGIVPDTGILVGEAGEDRRNNLLEVAGDFLRRHQLVLAWTWRMCTHRSQGYRGRGQADEAAVAGMRVVDGIGVLVAQLVDDFCYPVVVLGDEGIADEALELEGAALALVVELVVERFSNVGVHVAGGAVM
jgi:hypothetical protein